MNPLLTRLSLSTAKIILSIPAVLLLLQISPANSGINCTDYASSAVANAKKNIQQKCGFKGGRWSTDWQGHYNWCNAIKGGQKAQYEKNLRLAAINNCARNKKKNREKACNNYALAAVNKARINAKKGCGLKGGAYADDYAGHYQWCLNTPDSKVIAANAATNKGIAECSDRSFKVFDKPGGKWTPKSGNIRWLLIDGCSRKKPAAGTFIAKGNEFVCGKKNADKYCQRKGYKTSVSHKTKPVYFGKNLAATWWQVTRKPCHGKCHGFTQIVCKGIM